jgi:hypothetical protein
MIELELVINQLLIKRKTIYIKQRFNKCFDQSQVNEISLAS